MKSEDIGDGQFVGVDNRYTGTTIVMEVSQVKKELIHLKSWPFSKFLLHGRNFKEVSKDEVNKKVALATTPILPVVSLPDALLRTRCTALSEDLQNGAALQRSGIASSSTSRQGVYWCFARMLCLAETHVVLYRHLIVTCLSILLGL